MVLRRRSCNWLSQSPTGTVVWERADQAGKGPDQDAPVQTGRLSPAPSSTCYGHVVVALFASDRGLWTAV